MFVVYVVSFRKKMKEKDMRCQLVYFKKSMYERKWFRML